MAKLLFPKPKKHTPDSWAYFLRCKADGFDRKAKRYSSPGGRMIREKIAKLLRADADKLAPKPEKHDAPDE